jgi:hypothetical protein
VRIIAERLERLSFVNAVSASTAGGLQSQAMVLDRPIQVTVGAVGVAEQPQRPRLAVSGPTGTEGVERLVVAGQRFIEISQALVGLTEEVRCNGHSPRVVDAFKKVRGLARAVDSWPEVTRMDMHEGEV